MPHPIEIIKRFTEVSPDIEERLKSVIVERHLRKGDSISGSRAMNDIAYYILSGSARVYFLRGGREHTFSFFFDDEFIIPPRLLVDQMDDTLTIQFLEPTTVLTVSHEQVKDEMQASGALVNIPEVIIFCNLALSSYATYLEERFIQMQQSSAEDRYRWAVERYPRLLETASITQIASFLGVTKETLYRIRSGTY